MKEILILPQVVCKVVFFKFCDTKCLCLCCVWLQVSDTLKKFAGKVTTASLNERKEIFGELKLCLKSKGRFFC